MGRADQSKLSQVRRVLSEPATLPYIVGLTGGIGSGKTMVSNHFAKLGVPVIDTDVIARLIVTPGQPALANLVQYFGAGILLENGTLDRTALRKKAFLSSADKAKLDSITHPAIRAETLRQVAEVTFPYCIVVVPLLTPNSSFVRFIQRILVVVADHQSKIKRVGRRSKLTAEEVQQIMDTQLSDAQRDEFADDIINNDGSIAEAQRQVENLHQCYLTLANDTSARVCCQFIFD